MRLASLCLLIPMLLGISCSTTSNVGECPKWSTSGAEEFVKYNSLVGESPMVQDVKRRAKFCNAIAAPPWWEFWEN